MDGALRATLAWLLWLSRLVHVSAVSTVEDLHHEVRVGTAHILIAPGTYKLNAQLDLSQSITIEAAVPRSVVLVAELAVLGNIHPIQLNAPNGGSINLIGLNITGDTSKGMRVSGADVAFTDCNIYGFGGVFNFQDPQRARLTGCDIHHNLHAMWIEGGSHSLVEFIDCTFHHNNGVRAGVADIFGAGSTTWINCTMYSNSGWSGAIALSGAPRLLTMESCDIYSNKGTRYGGFLRANVGPAMIRNCQIHHNEATGIRGGGAIFIDSGNENTFTFVGCNIFSNRASYSGGAFRQSLSTSSTTRYPSSTFADCNIYDNYVSDTDSSELKDPLVGHGLSAESGTVRLMNGTRFSNNSIYANGNVNVFYIFPTPPAHWLPNGQCRVAREACGSTDAGCERRVAECSLETGSSTVCPATAFVQPCDWETSPELLGKAIYVLQRQVLINEPFPYPCGAGILGSVDGHLSSNMHPPCSICMCITSRVWHLRRTCMSAGRRERVPDVCALQGALPCRQLLPERRHREHRVPERIILPVGRGGGAHVRGGDLPECHEPVKLYCVP